MRPAPAPAAAAAAARPATLAEAVAVAVAVGPPHPAVHALVYPVEMLHGVHAQRIAFLIEPEVYCMYDPSLDEVTL